MAIVGEATVKVDYEMTDTAKAVLKREILEILGEPEVLKILLEELEKRLMADIRKMIRE